MFERHSWHVFSANIYMICSFTTNRTFLRAKELTVSYLWCTCSFLNINTNSTNFTSTYISKDILVLYIEQFGNEFSSGDYTTPGSPDDMFLKDLNPCLTPNYAKTKSKVPIFKLKPNLFAFPSLSKSWFWIQKSYISLYEWIILQYLIRVLLVGIWCI